MSKEITKVRVEPKEALEDLGPKSDISKRALKTFQVGILILSLVYVAAKTIIYCRGIQ